MPPEQHDAISTIVADTRRIALVGASPRTTRPSNAVMRSLLEVGYEVVPVTPMADEVLGLETVPSLAEVDGPIDLVDVFRRPEVAPDVAREAVAAGARALWLQVGIRSDEARRIATDGGLRYVEDACLGVEVAAERHRHEFGSSEG